MNTNFMGNRAESYIFLIYNIFRSSLEKYVE